MVHGTKTKVSETSESILYYLYHGILLLLVYWLLVAISAFMYFTFYYAFMPAPIMAGPIFPVFQVTYSFI